MIQLFNYIWAETWSVELSESYYVLFHCSTIPISHIRCGEYVAGGANRSLYIIGDVLTHGMWRALGSISLQKTEVPAVSYHSSKADWPVIVLTDLPDSNQSLQVLVWLVRVDVMQGTAVPGVSIGGCEVNGHLKEWQVNCWHVVRENNPCKNIPVFWEDLLVCSQRKWHPF